ncbi:MAG TPA: hypothetical protein VK669_13550 [Candidatus Limnocylindrales bacterium]|nr:hypothetical protein [Candidatus Limnocylindrales bacterium]
MRELRRRIATERFRFETFLSLVNAQTIESAAVDATMGVALAGLIAIMFPLFERAATVVASVAVVFMVIPALALAHGLFRIQTESPREILVLSLDAEDPRSIAWSAHELAKGQETNRERLLGKRALLRFSVRVTSGLILVWATTFAWRFAVVHL